MCRRLTRTEISLVDVILYFGDMPDVQEFGLIGFHRLNGKDNSKRAYLKTHVMSTVLLNLAKLEDVECHWRAYMMEDLQFNRDADKIGAVLCKCYRFAFSSVQLREGGCANMVARREKEDDDPSHPKSSQEPTHARTLADGAATEEVASSEMEVDAPPAHSAAAAGHAPPMGGVVIDDQSTAEVADFVRDGAASDAPPLALGPNVPTDGPITEVPVGSSITDVAVASTSRIESSQEVDGVAERESLDVASSTEEVACYIRASSDMFGMHATHYADVFTQV